MADGKQRETFPLPERMAAGRGCQILKRRNQAELNGLNSPSKVGLKYLLTLFQLYNYYSMTSEKLFPCQHQTQKYTFQSQNPNRKKVSITQICIIYIREGKKKVQTAGKLVSKSWYFYKTCSPLKMSTKAMYGKTSVGAPSFPLEVYDYSCNKIKHREKTRNGIQW